ncbi:rod shape-determining protein MreD [Lactobacillus acetotolerans]|jgi:rod shape-determining protein MreD|uniref:Rod shape-determining protein MreD n=1 Tax=Lactobacillus acetotolerans TaxID=1600 RepID=A0A0D6A3M0_9LACO|nr:rod shape-determining protein MreD [Lactobacillus acetotolerans]KRN42016.1 cell shape determining protein [Lactobacillus acetotolerans DSM 20749 = JCM 3825]MBN7276753.1 rod shape-determining protein MreD [Lactobacillus acetotolerans]QFG51432.1 rod shape-determining protein MreD [Lactobacillus acetotolerans]QGV04455.1 rod shape-determining protein MreD [Lactobacillus acetotolerans]QJD73371.1 rod shape-determining protein MreD [Lactobacillus acetotolerans]
MRILREWILAIALLVALILDGSISLYLHQFMVYGSYNSACLLVPIGIMLIALFDDTNEKEIWLALGTGIVADIYFLGIIGIYSVFLPLICWACQKVARFLPEVFWARLLVVLLGVIILSIYSWLILSMVGMISISDHLMLISLIPTVIWSLIFTVLTYWVWGTLARDYPFMINLDAYR